MTRAQHPFAKLQHQRDAHALVTGFFSSYETYKFKNMCLPELDAMTKSSLSRRALLTSGAVALGGLAMPSVLRAQSLPDYEPEDNPRGTARRNVMGFRNHQWQDHFSNLRRGAILCDTYSRALHYWSEDESIYLAHPCSVPMTEEFTRRGMTEVTLKRNMPTWIPTPNMRKRDPSLPERVEGGDPRTRAAQRGRAGGAGHVALSAHWPAPCATGMGGAGGAGGRVFRTARDDLDATVAAVAQAALRCGHEKGPDFRGLALQVRDRDQITRTCVPILTSSNSRSTCGFISPKQPLEARRPILAGLSMP